MQRISITNPQNIIDGTAKKYYFKLRNTGGPKGDKGDKGDTGATGPQGPQGDPCTVVVNSTATLEPGSNAYVTNTGSLSNAVLNFGIPQGPQGPQGAKGDKGDTGAKGDTGPRGPQGEKGTNATVYVGTTSTLAPGSQATVYNSGSDSNAVLNFGIPQGAKGDTGSQGPQGPQGPTGPAGQNFAATVVTELPTTGDSSKLYLTPKNYTTGTATGNPITISLGEDAGQIDSFKLDGDTYQQTYTGKNLLNLSASRDFNSGTDYSFDASSGVLTVTMSSAPAANRYSGWRVTGITTGAKYTFSIESFTNSALSNTDRAIMIRSHNGTSASELAILNKTQTSYTFTVPNDSVRLEFFFYIASGDTDSTSIITKPMLEAGETVTDYEPYVGVPSPNPDYPQQVQTVTGEQTISINGTDHEIDLGSIELCKIGNYQDYVYKSGEKWYVHKETGKYVYDNDLGENGVGSTYVAMLTPTLPTLPNMSFTAGLLRCNSYTPTMQKDTGLQGTNASGRIRVNTSLSIANNYAAVRALAAANNLTIYYPLDTATNTVITDTTLIAQLEAIRTASLENGTNTITNTATAPNLAGDMELGYYEYDPTNRYDKWLWLDINNNYEKLGS